MSIEIEMDIVLCDNKNNFKIFVCRLFNVYGLQHKAKEQLQQVPMYVQPSWFHKYIIHDMRSADSLIVSVSCLSQQLAMWASPVQAGWSTNSR